LQAHIAELNEKLEAEKTRQYHRDIDHRKETGELRARIARHEDDYESLR
jgi:hypothetical protein